MRQFILIEHSLRDLGGHYYTYAYSVLKAAEAAGFKAVLATHRSFRDLQAVPAEWDTYAIFPDKSRWTIALEQSPCGSVFERWRRWMTQRFSDHKKRRSASRFCAALAELFSRVRLQPGDHVFLASASDIDLSGLALFLRSDPNTRSIVWHVQFHHPLLHGREPDYASQVDAQTRARLGFLDALTMAEHHDLRLYCTTPQLARQYQLLKVTSITALTYAIHPVFCRPHARADGRPMRIACLGHTRLEKGYEQLPALIRALWPEYLSCGRGELLLQTHRVDLRNKLAALMQELGARSAGQGLVYASFPLDLEQYADLVRSADIALMLYDSTRYYARCSGVLLESLIAGVPVIIPAGGWLAEQIEPVNQDYLQQVADSAHARTVREHLIHIGALQFCSADACSTIDAPRDAQQILLEFRCSSTAPGPGTFVQASLRQIGADGSVQDFATVLPAIGDRVLRVIFDLDPRRDEQRQLCWRNAYGNCMIQVSDVRVIPLRDRHPRAAIGLTAADPQQVPLLTKEIGGDLEHYQQHAQRSAPLYAARYSGESVIKVCTREVTLPDRASAHGARKPAPSDARAGV